MDTYLPDLTVFENIFQNMSILGSSGFIAIIASFLAMAIITRDVEKWKTLWFPSLLVVWAIGIPLGGLGSLAMLFSAIMFTVEILSTQVIGNVIRGINEGTKRGGRGINRIVTGIAGASMGLTRSGRGTIERWGKERKEARVVSDRFNLTKSEGELKRKQYAREQKKLREQIEENEKRKLKELKKREKLELERQRRYIKESNLRMKAYKSQIERNKKYKTPQELLEEARKRENKSLI